jgi:hypothetical protein
MVAVVMEVHSRVLPDEGARNSSKSSAAHNTNESGLALRRTPRGVVRLLVLVWAHGWETNFLSAIHIEKES